MRRGASILLMLWASVVLLPRMIGSGPLQSGNVALPALAVKESFARGLAANGPSVLYRLLDVSPTSLGNKPAGPYARGYVRPAMDLSHLQDRWHLALYNDRWGNKAGCGWRDTTAAWGLARLTPTQAGCATQVEIWTTDETTDVDIYIYDTFSGGATSGLLWSRENLAFAYAGYHSVRIEPPLPLAAGNDVAVKVKFGNRTNWAAVPTDWYSLDINVMPVPGQSFISRSGQDGTWYDLGAGSPDMPPCHMGIRLRLAPCGPQPTGTPTPTPTASRTATVTCTPGGPTPTPTPTPTPSATPAATAHVMLRPGWNLISLPLAPVNTAITDVLAPIGGYYDLVYAYDAANTDRPWSKYNAFAPPFLNTLTQVNETQGLWLRSSAAISLTVGGTLPVSPGILLKMGWNLVGYPSQVTRPVTQALAAIDGQYELVYAYDATNPDSPWKKYNVDAPPFLNTLREMGPGWGYWIRATEDCVWQVP